MKFLGEVKFPKLKNFLFIRRKLDHILLLARIFLQLQELFINLHKIDDFLRLLIISYNCKNYRNNFTLFFIAINKRIPSRDNFGYFSC